jgi:hypothetical protein
MPSLTSVIRDYHGDGDFAWTDVEVGTLVHAVESMYDLLVDLETAWSNAMESGPCADQDVGGCDPHTDPCGECGRANRGWTDLPFFFENALDFIQKAGL